ncbi:hypothetical protein EsDP_00005926 [Epichloe bromicola]|uniref:CobW C-terminal domain-containing protein n=1 Tax=Epichloe bromicola TaxID=79588 RepID=A0ABQ0CW43_9HYPO
MGSSAKKKSKKSVKLSVPKRSLPVTLLSGFLGAGKTTLLQHILRSDHGLKIAIVVNDIGAINVDAALIKKTHSLTKTKEKVIALQNGCICCTLRGDLLEELVRISQLEEFDYIIIESSGISEPEQVAETFDARLAEQMGELADIDTAMPLDETTVKVLKQLKAAGGLGKFARLDTTVTVIDSFTMLNDFDTADILSSRRDDVTPEDERTVSDLMVDQIEFADVIILNKIDMTSEETREEAKSLVKKLNHRARVIECCRGKVDVAEIVNTGLFKLDVAQSGYGWLQDLHAMTVREVNGRNVLTPKPETEEYNVQSFIYTRYRPFDPRRLFALLHDKFILQLEHSDDDEEDDENEMDQDTHERAESHADTDVDMDGSEGPPSTGSASGSDGRDSSSEHSDKTGASTERSGAPSLCGEPLKQAGEDANMNVDDDMVMPSDDVILANKRAHPTFRRLFRSKGEYFLATRPHRAGDWSQAGAMLTMTGGRPWFCTLPPEEYMTGDDEVDSLVQHDMKKGGEWGDRRQELVFIGEKLDHANLERLLDECLLTDEEMDKWTTVMRDERLDDSGRVDALQDVFDDGFPDWTEDGDEEDEEDMGHEHSHGSSPTCYVGGRGKVAA